MTRAAPPETVLPNVGEGAEEDSDHHTILIVGGIFSALTLTFAILSPGFLTADALTHFLYAKYAFAEPHYLTNVWGRPFCTALYAVPAALSGRLGVRALSIGLGLLCAGVAYRIACEQKMRWPILAFILTLGQPLLFLHSFSEMTELPFATLIAFAFLAYQRRRFAVVAILVAISPMARPEGFGFIVLSAVAFLFHRRWAALVILPLGLLAWDLVGWLNVGRSGPWWRWLPNAWPYSANSMYPRGNILQFVAQLPIIVSPLVLPAVLIGIAITLRGALTSWSRRHRQDAADEAHLDRGRALTAIIPLIILTVHSLLYATGKLGSFGEARYMLVVAPFWGVLAARGWEWLWERLGFSSSPVRWAAFAVLVPLPIAVAVHALPIPLPQDFHIASRAAQWYRGSEDRADHPHIAASHPGVYYYLDISPTDPKSTVDWTHELVKRQPPGTVLIWDPLYAPRNASTDRAFELNELEAAGWVRVERAEEAINGDVPESARWHIFRSVAPDPTMPAGQ